MEAKLSPMESSIVTTTTSTQEITPSDDQPIDGDKDAQLTENPYHKAIQYMEKHQILHMLQQLTCEIIHKRPEDPLQFIVNELSLENHPDETTPAAKTS